MGFSPSLYKVNNGDMKPARSLDVRAVFLIPVKFHEDWGIRGLPGDELALGYTVEV
ncbi:4-oxalocrotonate tautomerase [Alcanivorax sp. NBRC 101098]|uniref:hypothetical protein n=1 Tax=Alcanivorax sp. NBRC 101098 TaxID=1113728 RepID=UPI0004ABE3F2|nr:hypothetical protein [Alcanivorax sp. NBRC 101098]BAP15226.1 4-oxalocrotonate tautomerase [Alcanivorax sp. NBRC 101098]